MQTLKVYIFHVAWPFVAQCYPPGFYYMTHSSVARKTVVSQLNRGIARV